MPRATPASAAARPATTLPDGVRDAQGDVIAAQQGVRLDRQRAVGRESAEESGAEQQSQLCAASQHDSEQHAEGE